MSEKYDVICVGARIAGAIAASLLGDYGHRILALDRARFPSDTLSTHFFRAPTLRAFKRAGVLDEVLRAAPHLSVDYNVVDGIIFPEPVTKPEDFPFYMCVRRITLDAILAQRLKQTPGVEVREGARVEELIREDGRVIGVKWSEAGRRHEATARVIVGADGVHSFVAAEVHPQVESDEPVHRTMYYAYYRGVEPKDGPAAEFHFLGNHLVYIFPCDDNLTLVAASLPIEEFREFKRNPEGKLMAVIGSMRAAAPRLEKAEREGPVRGTGTIPGYMRVPHGPGWALVGDSAMVMDPWSGQGMDQASTHAVILADQLHAFLSLQSPWEEAMKTYHQARNEFSEKTFRRTCALSRDLRPMTREALKRRGLA